MAAPNSELPANDGGGRRKHATEIPLGCPRMVRRGAISYSECEGTAPYIRSLVCKGNGNQSQSQKQSVNLLHKNLNAMMLSRRTGRRGSLRATSSTKDVMKETVLQGVNVEMYLMNNFAKVESWNFDVFSFKTITEDRPLFHLGFHLLQKHNLINLMNLDAMRLMQFLACVEKSYHPENSYHNSTHAADVSQALNCLLSEPKLLSKLTSAELLAALLAAMCHDIDHPGVNQSYLLNTSNHLAFIHGKNSLLEHHHCHQAKAILLETGLLKHLPAEERQEIVSIIEAMILATDVSRHGSYLTKFQGMLKSSKGVDLDDKKDRQFMLSIAIKAADISNPARNFTLSKVWSEHIMDEFFRQGDMERELELPISNSCDRYTTVMSVAQNGFFSAICAPLFDSWYQLFNSHLSKLLCENISKNKAYWMAKTREIEAAVTGKLSPANSPKTTPKREGTKVDTSDGQSVVDRTEEPSEATAPF